MNKLVLSIGIAFCTMSAQAQVVDIPDANFKQALIDRCKADTNNDGQIQIEEAALVTKIDISFYYPIKNLEGIQAFSNLTYFDCTDIQITKLDVSKNLALTYLDCSHTQIGLLDVGKNTALALLNCSYTLLTSLDVSQNINLNYLNCSVAIINSICINDDQLAKTSNDPQNWQKDATDSWSTTCGIVTGIEEQELLHTNKTLIRILTPLGQELQPEQATEGLFIYQYSDGSTRKVMK